MHPPLAALALLLLPLAALVRGGQHGVGGNVQHRFAAAAAQSRDLIASLQEGVSGVGNSIQHFLGSPSTEAATKTAAEAGVQNALGRESRWPDEEGVVGSSADCSCKVSPCRGTRPVAILEDRGRRA